MLKKLFPFSDWFNQYFSKHLKMDVTAGVTVITFVAMLAFAPHLKQILLVAVGINDMDVPGQETLSLVAAQVDSAGIDLSLCRVTHPVIDVPERTPLLIKTEESNIYPNIDTAFGAIYDITYKGEYKSG